MSSKRKVELKCEICGKVFLRYKSEVERNKKRGSKICCSVGCASRSHPRREVELKCETCGKLFLRYKPEADRNKNLGRKTYCSLGCVGHSCIGQLLSVRETHPENLGSKCKRDEWSPFRWHMKHIRGNCKSRGLHCDLSLRDLKEQWDKQKGRCCYTDWPLISPISVNHYLPKSPDRASIDRIDSSKGYTKDNIHFVSMIANFAKNSWSDEDLYEFCEAVVEHHKGA